MAKAKSREQKLREAEARGAAKAAARRQAERLQRTGADAKVVEIIEGTTRTYAVRAQRKDVFQILLERRALSQDAFEAVRSYEADLATAAGANTPERRPDHVRGSTEGAPGQSISQAQIDASKRVECIDKRLSRRDLKLLVALLHEGAAYRQTWRATVEAVTAETNEVAQTARVRAMAENVADVRQWKRKEAA